MSKRVTIKTIAHDLGISHMTVSRALSDSPNVNTKTRALIQKRAAELGYVKSAAAAAMRGDGTRIVGLLVPNLVNEFYARFANALALLCEDNDLHLITHLTNDDPTREKLALLKLQELQTNSLVIVPAPHASQDRMAPHQYAGMKPVQLIRTQALEFETDTILVNDSSSIKAAVNALASKGHARISYFGGHADLSSGRQRKAAFVEAMEANNLPLSSDLIQTDRPSFDMGAQKAMDVISGQIESTAIICGGFEISNGALDACLKAGVSLPGDLSFVGYGDPGFYRWIQGGISTISLPVDALAEKALALLTPKVIETDPRDYVFETELIQRASS